ncbi:MAG: hypothetical protein IJI24_02450 [Lachnospiraceae bacterium]|nr:hypothetical protein [Lachnospiraceae bacterium]
MEDYRTSPSPAPPKANGALGTASLVCMIVAVFTVRMFFISIPMAALSIIFNALSRGNLPPAQRHRHILIISLGIMIISAGLTVYSFYTVMSNPQYRKQLESIIQYYEHGLYETEYVPPSGEESNPVFVIPQEPSVPSGSDHSSGGDFI